MTSIYEYTFENVTTDHTITVEFEAVTPPTPTPVNGIKMFVKENGQWVPLFEDTGE